ncbi:MAG: EAL domain-containing protein [Nevskia sp.]|nr:EAL domain-containing protein [Nevskia sp.]
MNSEMKRQSSRDAESERLRLVIEAAPNAMLMTDAAGRIVMVNSQAEKLFGYERRELLGQPVEILVPQAARGHHHGYREGFARAPAARPMGAGRDLHGLRKDGSEVPIEIGLNPLTMPDGRYVLASVIDITARLNAEKMQRALQAAELRESILDNLPFSVISTDPSGIIVSANPAAEHLLGYNRHELVGRSVLILHDREELRRRAQELLLARGAAVSADFQVIVAASSRGADEREWTYVRKDGKRVPVNIAMTAMRDESGQVNGYLKVAYDITQRKEAETLIRHIAHHDALTGLPNRALLMDRLDMAIHQARRHGQHLAVLMLDLDHFKRINDTLGHLVGDRLLLGLAQRMQSALREVDTLARLGGDEFVVVLTEVERRESVVPAFDRLMQAITAPLTVDGHELAVTASIGAALYPEDGDDATALIKNADTAMYQAKAAGRNGVRWFTASMYEQIRERMGLGSALTRALRAERLKLHYQPELTLHDGRIVGMEALARWSDEVLGVIGPERFIPVAEESGLILELGEWVLRRACRDCAALRRALGRPLTVAVNVSPRQLQSKEWPQGVAQALADSGLPPQGLELELTEGTLMENPEQSAEILRAVRRLGVGVVIDDFGTGYSSLSYLTRFPIDKIKIDRAFVRDLLTDATDAAVVGAIIAMARSLGIRVVAEGIESERQWRHLLGRGCDQGQGYFFGVAVAADEFAARAREIERWSCSGDGAAESVPRALDAG